MTDTCLRTAVYGFCPACGKAGVSREKRPYGNDKCKNGHTYSSAQAVGEIKTHTEPQPVQFYAPDASGEIVEKQGKLIRIVNNTAFIDVGTDHPFITDASNII